MLKQYTSEVLGSLRTVVAKIDARDMRAYEAKDEPYPGFVGVLEYIREHALFFRLMLGPKGDPAFSNKLYDSQRSHGGAVAKLGIRPPAAVSWEYLAAFLSRAHVGIIQHWVDTGMVESPRDLAKFVTHIYTKGVVGVMGLS